MAPVNPSLRGHFASPPAFTLLSGCVVSLFGIRNQGGVKISMSHVKGSAKRSESPVGCSASGRAYNTFDGRRAHD